MKVDVVKGTWLTSLNTPGKQKLQFGLLGLLYGEHTVIDGEYILGHRPILNNKQMYSRAIIMKLTAIPNGNWFSTLDVQHKPLVLTQQYDPEKYPKYDNYNAINIDKIKDIPYDYDGPMGVPITILQYDLENVELYECLNDNTPETRTATIEGKEKYCRVLIKKNFEVVGMAAGAREITGIPYTGDIPGPFLGGGQSMQERLSARYQVVDAKNNPWTKGNPIYKRVIIRKKGNEKSDKQRNSRMDSKRTTG